MRFLLGFVLGLLIGASIALAFAPQPGVETRTKVLSRIRERAGREGEEQT